MICLSSCPGAEKGDAIEEISEDQNVRKMKVFLSVPHGVQCILEVGYIWNVGEKQEELVNKYGLQGNASLEKI